MPCSPLANPTATRAVLAEFGLEAKYRLGQNFLVDDNVIAHILELAGFEEDELPAADADAAGLPTVLEVGPGIGTLTVALLRHAHVVAIERDPDLAPVLASTTAAYASRFALLQADALKVQPEAIQRACAQLAAPQPRMVVANLPYNIAATVVLDWLARMPGIQAMVVMVQSEVADRMCARPGTKSYGAYTVKLALHAQATARFQVSPSCFMPAPHVESAVIRLQRPGACAEVPPDLLERACDVAEAAFAQRRKTIRNSMQTRYTKPEIDAMLASCNIPPTTRGETLTPADYLALARAYQQLEGR